MNEPITHGPVDGIAYKVCKCSRCGFEDTCTPSFDFYIRRPGPDDGPLYCYACLCAEVGLKPALRN
jgi:hypothetical protein